MKSFNFDVSVCNGHDLRAIEKALTKKKLNKNQSVLFVTLLKAKDLLLWKISLIGIIGIN